MPEKYLTLDQNLCAARVFLNAFGLILEDKENVQSYERLKTVNLDGTDAGEVYFRDGKVVIDTKCVLGNLLASYDISKIKGFKDFEGRDGELKEIPALYVSWSAKINFEVKSAEQSILGVFQLRSSTDTEFGTKISAHPELKVKKGDTVHYIKFQRDGCSFASETIMKTEDDYYEERITVSPWNESTGYFIHDVIKGKEIRNWVHPYHMHASVTGYAEKGHIKGLYLERYNGEISTLKQDFPIDVVDYNISTIENRTAGVVQKSMLIHKMDPSIFTGIEKIRKYLTNGGISLMDNLVAICFDSVTDEEIEAMFGLKRKKALYQNNADNLENAYLGSRGVNAFLLPGHSTPTLPNKQNKRLN